MRAMQGVSFGHLHRYFDDGTPYGLVNMSTGKMSFNPSNKTIVTAGAALCAAVQSAAVSPDRVASIAIVAPTS